MTEIKMLRITEEIRETISNEYGKMQADHIHMEEGSASFAAVLGNEILGFISVYPKRMLEPLDTWDAFIDIIEIHEGYRQKGIASKLIHESEKWAKEEGYRQIRAWSSQDKTEAIAMWYKLGYAMCPAEVVVNQGQLIIKGYYVAKTLKR